MKKKLPIALGIVSFFLLAFFFSFLFNYFSRNSAARIGNKIPSKNTQVPLPNTTPGDKDVTTPQVILDPVMGSPNQTRIFTVKGNNKGFSVKKIVVYAGDIVNIKFTAVDGIMDISFPDFNIKQTAGAGETKTLEFQATDPGTYPFLCTSCKNGDFKGELLVIPR